jgi:hypothetical protein
MVEDAPKAVDADSGEDDGAGQGRQRSKVQFPYSDLNAALAVANAIHEHAGTSECSLQQISAWMGQSIKSSGFRVQLSTSRLFGIIDSSGTESYRLTALGRQIVDPQTARKAKAEAFLNVPLFRLLYNNHKEGVLPPAAALEREIAGLGVAAKQKDRARQVFERSAEQAGFFEHGKNRLVVPAFKGESPKKEPPTHMGGGGGDGDDNDGGPLDPVVAALIKKLPTGKKEWPVDDRVTWLQMITMAFQLAYGQVETIEVKKKEEDKKDA